MAQPSKKSNHCLRRHFTGVNHYQRFRFAPWHARSRHGQSRNAPRTGNQWSLRPGEIRPIQYINLTSEVQNVEILAKEGGAGESGHRFIRLESDAAWIEQRCRSPLVNGAVGRAGFAVTGDGGAKSTVAGAAGALNASAGFGWDYRL